MISLGMIGTPQLIIITSFILIIFSAGFYVGKKSGYIKRIKEEETKKKNQEE